MQYTQNTQNQQSVSLEQRLAELEKERQTQLTIIDQLLADLEKKRQMPIAEMTTEELQALLGRIQEEITERGRIQKEVTEPEKAQKELTAEEWDEIWDETLASEESVADMQRSSLEIHACIAAGTYIEHEEGKDLDELFGLEPSGEEENAS